MVDLITKYLNDELTKEEWEELKVWLNKNSTNKTSLNKLQSYLNVHDDEVENMKAMIWKELQEEAPAPNVDNKRHKINCWSTYLKAAAILVVALGFVFLFYSTRQQPEAFSLVNIIEKSSPAGAKKTTRLPDNSIVTLNSDSKIAFPERFSDNERIVSLEGEAFFEVSHNPEKPFYVQLDGEVIKVLGTSFNVKSYPGDSMIYVSVATGKVSFTSATGKEAVLASDQMVTYTDLSHEMIVSDVDKLESFGWKDRILYFRNKPFNEVISELERWYGVEIEVKGRFSHIGTFSGEFEDETLETVLNGLSFVYQFDFSIDKKQVALNKKHKQ